ncbi:MAG: GNAT family N-acetyltransferase [Proteobacteria bacterium]|nr:GNAT family N-acetyltransferase [Pseudomonadota bacterium]MDA0929121.1 GNAT family N-acetyltransferase [Pseudomonadota bacterium]
MKGLQTLAVESELADFRLTKPNGLAPRLFFKAYCGHQPVGMAQLSSRAVARQKLPRKSTSGDSSEDKAPGIRYCLKLIEVSQNYRNKGIGSALLNEVIAFCKDERVNSLVGEAKGDTEQLRRWYKDRGFDLDDADNISLTLG